MRELACAADPRLAPSVVCAECGARSARLKRCKGCSLSTGSPAWYCGAGCQRAHWRVHKGQCLNARDGKEKGSPVSPICFPAVIR
mmetsp:Transcript_66350/g.117840  ORF Transcript_66350/g.117840 Transcript_66350/m.117840 type:complete len:85 (+) Transcript_66350:3-257(+)